MSDPDANVRATFRELTLALMEWNPPPLMGSARVSAAGTCGTSTDLSISRVSASRLISPPTGRR